MTQKYNPAMGVYPSEIVDKVIALQGICGCANYTDGKRLAVKEKSNYRLWPINILSCVNKSKGLWMHMSTSTYDKNTTVQRVNYIGSSKEENYNYREILHHSVVRSGKHPRATKCHPDQKRYFKIARQTNRYLHKKYNTSVFLPANRFALLTIQPWDNTTLTISTALSGTAGDLIFLCRKSVSFPPLAFDWTAKIWATHGVS